MRDSQFQSEIEIQEYLAMLPGYPFGDLKRNPKNFHSLALLQQNADGTLNRTAILAYCVWKFTDDERVELLKVSL